MTNRGGVPCLVLGGLFALAASCSSKDKPGTFMGVGATGGVSGSRTTTTTGGTGGKGTAGTGGKGGGGSGGTNSEAGVGGDGASLLAPQISITKPAEASDPNVGPVLVSDELTVLCSVRQSTLSGAKPIDASTVKITMLDGTGTSLKSVAGIPTNNANEYSATFVLTGASSGPISFECTASDTASPRHDGMATVNTLVDRGPDIAVSQPVAGSAHNLLGAMDVEFTVSAAPIATGDTQADLSGVTLQVAGKSIVLPFIGAGLYKTSVDFNQLFATAPSGSTPILIMATNQRRNPGKATNATSYNFVLDGIGPVITLTSPLPGAVIGPASVLTFTVTDTGSGVDSPTVTATLNGAQYHYDPKDLLWSADMSGNYTFKMGTVLEANTTDSQITVGVLASDEAQNPSTGNTRLFYLDTRPPFVDLDPPPTYFKRPGTVANTLQCSDLFDPVGPDAPNDLSHVGEVGYFRSLVWDDTNRVINQDILYPALTDQSSVRLYVQKDTTQPLMYHGSPVPGPYCDEIYTGLGLNQKNPTDLPLPFFKLTALPSETSPSGSVDWAVDAALAPPANDLDCMVGAVSTKSRLCNGFSKMSMIIHHPVVKTPHEPVIYAVQPDVGVNTSPACMGQQWDIFAAISQATVTPTPNPGWICVAVRAQDTVANHGISAPLRICLDDGMHGTNPCAGTPPPSCTDNCTPPPHFQVPPVSFSGYD